MLRMCLKIKQIFANLSPILRHGSGVQGFGTGNDNRVQKADGREENRGHGTADECAISGRGKKVERATAAALPGRQPLARWGR